MSAEPGDPPVAFTLNGRRVEVRAPEAEPLLYVLRDRLGAKAVRFGCGEGYCGACVALIDGRPEATCSTPLWAVAGRTVETADALLEADPPHPLVEAFAEARAGQCGWCLPGLAMRAKALLEADPAPTQEAIAQALDGGLCRCGAHPRILRAVAAAAEAMR